MVLITNSTCRKATKVDNEYAGFWVNDNHFYCVRKIEIEQSSSGLYEASGGGGCNTKSKGKVRVVGNTMYVGGNRLKIISKPYLYNSGDSVTYDGRKHKAMMKMRLSDHVSGFGRTNIDFYKIKDY